MTLGLDCRTPTCAGQQFLSHLSPGESLICSQLFSSVLTEWTIQFDFTGPVQPSHSVSDTPPHTKMQSFDLLPTFLPDKPVWLCVV